MKFFPTGPRNIRERGCHLDVLILSSSTAGGGHWSAATALGQALQSIGDTPILLDVHERPYVRYPLSRLPDLYEPLVRRYPRLWTLLFRATNGARRWNALGWASRPWSRSESLGPRPQVVVSTIPMLDHRFVTRGLRGEDRPVPFAVLVTDPVTVHHAWRAGSADLYLVSTDIAARACVETLGIPEIKIRRLPPAIGLQFVPPRDRAAVRSQLGLDPTAPTILVVGGASGVGNIEIITRELIQRGLGDAQLVVVCGRNQALATRLKEIVDPTRTHVLGFVRNMHMWMQASDVLLTKASPGVVAEALSCELPVFITGAIEGTESGNTQYYESMGVARSFPQLSSCMAEMDRFLSGNHDHLDALRSAIRATGPWNGIMDIAQAIRNLGEDWNYRLPRPMPAVPKRLHWPRTAVLENNMGQRADH